MYLYSIVFHIYNIYGLFFFKETAEAFIKTDVTLINDK
jgi:hypothetical protein